MLKQSELKCDVPAVCLDLYGKRFFAALDEKTTDCCEKLLNEARARLEVLQNSKAKSKKSDKEICRLLCRGLDGLLGKGTVRKVLGKDRRCLEDVAGLMCFVLAAFDRI